MDTDVDVVIVGRVPPDRCGATAGSSTALDPGDRGEATPRIGGRAWTCDVGGLPSTSAVNGSPYRRPKSMDTHRGSGWVLYQTRARNTAT